MQKLIDLIAPRKGLTPFGLAARVIFAVTLLPLFFKSALTKFDGLSLSAGAYVQIFPKAMEEVGYNPSALSFLHTLVAYAGSIGEFVLPIALVVGLLTRASALGMIFFIAVMSYVDVTGHGAHIGWERLLWVGLILVIFVQGGGKFSLDRLIFGKQA